MNNYDVKFLLNFDKYDYSAIKYIFSDLKCALNWQFDENINPNLINEDIDYKVRDVSDLERNEIDKIIDSFFKFNFDEIINVPLYRLLVLKNNEKLQILANISSLIFDYSSIKDFYELFADLNKSYPKKDLDTYYDDVKDYFNSPNFKKDSEYWTKYVFNSSNYVNFYNLKNNAYKSRIINVDKDSVSTFIENHDCSLFDFYGSIFSLYLSRIDRIGGCLLKTIILREKTDLEIFDKNTLFKVDVNQDEPFDDLLEKFSSSFKNASSHTKVDVDNYLDETSCYSIYDFTEFNENIHVYTGEHSAITLNINENSLELIYNTDLFSDIYIEHMAKNIENLISNALNFNSQVIGDIDILSDEEKSLLSHFCKGKTVEVDEDKLLSHAFREHALKNPDAIAVDDGINRITYGELEKSTNSIANDLHENHEIKSKSRVGLMLPRNYHFIELVLALNKIGVANVPIDLSFPINRIEHMLNTAQAEHLVTTKDIAQNLDLNIKIIPIEDLRYNDDVNVEIFAKKDDILTILFTSGTTGIPKGVMIYNRQLIWASAAFVEMFNISYGDRIGSYLSFSFVALILIFATVYMGGIVRLFNENEQKNILLLIKDLKEKHMNSLILPPNIGMPIFENEDLKLDYLILAGAKLNELSKKDRHTKLVNFYGTTEVIFAITNIYDLNDTEDDCVPIGKPIANTWAYILDDNNNRMPIGVPGEICISGGLISPGYCNNPKLTSQHFVDNPFSDCEINKKMYRTGDIGFYNFDGEIEIIGREDDQLSVRGFRIESDEILSIMKSFGEISDIYLDVDNDTLIAYYTTNDKLDVNEVKEALKNQLPYYMIPTLFIELEKIPLNLNGKIDKTALKTDLNNENIEITDDIIKCVADAFKEVLNLDHVLIDDDFVSLGGTSLSAMKLQLILKERLNVQLSSNEIINLSTPKDIGEHIKSNLNVHSTFDEGKYTFDDLCPLSESQLNVYLDESVNDMGTAYNNPFKIELKDNYSTKEIKDALIKLFDVFPILKARVINDKGDLSFAFDGEPEITDESSNDLKTFVKPFELDKSLSRFSILDSENTISLYADFHHLIFDGTSLNILLKKFLSILNGEDGVDFADNGILRQLSFEENIGSEYMDNAKKFFNKMLADRDEVYELLPSVDGDKDDFEIIDAIDIDTEYLNAFLQNHSVTPNQFFASVFAYALSRFSSSDKVLFNLIEDGRGHIDLSESVGMFVKTLPILIDCKNQDVDSYMEYSSDLINSVMKYDLYPFRVLANEYGLNSNILFQYSHNLFSDVINNEDLGYGSVELTHDLNADLSFDILNNGEDGLTIRVLYSPKYSKAFIERFVESYKFILHEMINADELKDINYISNEDIELLDAYNQTEHPLFYDDVLDAFNDNLARCPKNSLVTYKNNSFTYEECAFIANKIANNLKDMGIKKDDNVAFLVERFELYMFSILGILSAGAAYVPLDEALPDERIKFMIDDTDAKAVIVCDETYGRAKNLSEEIGLLNISNIEEDVGTSSKLDVVYGDLACILYTSGTTGLPKGVKITRKSLINVAESYIETQGLNNGDVYGLFSAISFDVTSFVITAVMCAGACLSIIPQEIRLNMSELNEYLIEQNVSHVFITTQVGKLFMQSVDGTSLDVLLVAGEKLGEFESPEDYLLVDAYGPTEAFAFVSSIDNNDKVDGSSVGMLNYNTRAYILDDEFRRVPVGAVGELYLAGYQIADGYLNRPEENMQAFISNPFDDAESYGVLYRTGDMVRFLPDGSLGIVGRRDGQVKIRGNRVELTEIESTIRNMDKIEDVTVQTITNNENNELIAYIVLSDGFEDNNVVDYIREYVSRHKPEYMVPSYVVELERIPLNVNGKVDKRALPDIDLDSLHADYVAPTTEDERVIVEAFERVFNQKISIYDDFIRLGGDSLTAIRIVSYLEDYDISAVDILSLHTPYAIAKNIEKFEYDLDINNLESGCPLSESQLNVYLDIVANDKYDAYSIPLFMEISKEYDVNEICDALDKMLEVHPILSTHIGKEFEAPYLIKESKPPIIVESDINENFIIEFINQRFDLNDCLCRFLIVNDKDNFKLVAVFNHIIFDALSYNVFKQDLLSILDGKLPDVDESFLKVSAFSKQIQNSDDYADAEKFYESMLADSGESSVLMESTDAGVPGALQIDLELNNDLLKSFLAKHRISENVLFTGAFAYTLSRFTGSEYASFNLIENGRDRFNNFNTIGMYVNTLPLLVNCKNQNITSFMEDMASLIYNVTKYNYYPFRLLANEYDINSNILFQFLPEWIEMDLNGDIPSNTPENDILTRRDNMIADFSVEVTQKSEDYSLNIMYCDKYSNNFAQHFAASYKLILQQLISVEKLDEINYITSGDIEILDEYNQTQRPLKYDDILDAFNDNLARYPKNSLVTYNDASYSYDEGTFLANKISGKLKSMGINKDDNVAFLVERSELYMFSILGILSAGAVYVPLDDDLPDERIKFMIDDTDAKVVIVCDETYNRAKKLSEENRLLNISNIIKEPIGTSSKLDVVYGDLACILYTSGTTGIPKGVKITRKAIVNYVDYYVKKSKMTFNDVFALYASIGFDVGAIKSIFVPLYCGACLDIVPGDVKLNLNKLNSHLTSHNVTHAHLPTQVGKMFINEVDNHSLDVLVTGGEKLGEVDFSCDYVFVDSYGPTEACVSVTAIEEADKIDSSSIGYLLDNLKAYVLDDEFRRVSVGAVGELYLAGYQIADGYLNRPEENAQAFISNPFDDGEGYDVLYRTGDMVRVLRDGSLGIVGRRDSQVKIRGNRVELTEVEYAIRSMDDIEDVTVQTIANNENNELIAYIVLSEGSAVDNVNDYVCQYVSMHNPEYMVPSYVVELDSIPLNANGKVDKSALPDVDVGSLQAEYLAPTNETEKHIIDAFELVFNQKGIGLNDDFVRLGGDSITAIRVVSLLEKNDINCSAGDILNYKTPFLIAQNVESIERISYDAVVGVMDLLPIQEHFFNQINEDDFSQHFVIKSTEKLDITVLQESFDELCNVHDMLRAKYSYDENGKAIQEILPVNTGICEINEHDVTENLEEALKEIHMKSLNSLGIENNLIEINLVHYNNESYLLFIIHHLIVDGVSWNILITDLTNIYTNLKQGKEIELLRPYPYRNWVEDVKDLAKNISYEEKQHWTRLNRQMDDSTIKGDSKLFAFDIDVNYDADNLLMLSEEEYWALAIARAYKMTYGRELIFNRESHGRDESIAKLNRTIGWFTSQYPILINTSNKNDGVSIMNDVYNIKTALKDVDNLGLNYLSLIYTTKEFEFKHCPVTFNFLSSEFTFKNELFESYVPKSTLDNEEINIKRDSTSYGITFNIARNADSYMISGDYANNTYLGDEFNIFIENIKSELEFIGNYEFNDNNIICCLSESQLGVYLDEKVHEKDTAYSAHGIFEYDAHYSIGDVKDAIHALIKKHPILKGRILDTDNIPLLICDSYPTIEIIGTGDHSNLIKAFNLNESLARFYILDNEDKKFVFYDMHHIISDATSLFIINKELEQALLGKLDDAIDLGFAYASRDSFESQYDYRYEHAQKFFRDEFAGIDEVQPLLSDPDGDKGSVSLPIRGIHDDIEVFAENIGISIGSLLNATFAYSFSRFTGSDKVYYNFTEHGRHENYSQNAVGMFVRTIPVIAQCENKSIKDYLADMSDLILNSMTNSIYPFRLLAREYNLNIDAAFEYNHDLNDFDIGNDLVVSDDADGISDFLCVVNDLEDGFVVTVSHLDKFSQHTAKQFVKVFKEVLLQFLEKEKLEDISYVSNEDIELLDSCNKTQHQLKYGDILDAFNDNLAKYPKNSLVTYENNSYTYDEGAFIANKIANNLKDMAIKKEDNVAFLVERSELYMFTILGILSAGAAYVPLDDSLPDERIKFMMNDTDAKAVIVCDETYNRVKNLSEEIKLLNISNIINGDVGTSSKLDAVYGDLSCILYTSGTTSLPKGVKITRRAVLNLSQSYCDAYDFGRGDVYALYSNIGFDAGSQAILQTIYAGAHLTVIPEDIKFNIPRLNEYFIKQNVTHTFISTQVAKLFMEQIDNTSLNVLSVGGEKLGESKSPKDYRLIDAYGPTEAFAFVSSIDNNDKMDGSSAGALNQNTRAYILDDEFRRVPVGAVGELYLAGYQISDGYLNRPEENAQAFLSNPFDDMEDYGVLYRTGDMVRLLADGSLGIVGRRDSQVKIRGNRVELTEVESAIRDMDDIEDVTVQTISNNENNELIAYIVLSEGFYGEDIVNSVREFVSKCKPDYMVPSYVITLDEIPLNVNGKVDKRALPDVDMDSLHDEYVPPRNQDEKEIVEAFEKALDLEKVGIYDDFIRLGGDSLTAIKLLSHIKSNDVTMADIFTFRTPEAIAKNISEYSFDLDIYSLEDGCPLNSAQSNVFADITGYNKSNAYHVMSYIPISKEYGLEKILGSLDEMLKMHPILSMRLSGRYDAGNNDVSNRDALNDLIKTAKKFGTKKTLNIIKEYGIRDIGGLYNMLRTLIMLFKGEYPYLVKGNKPPISVKSKFDKDILIDFFSESFDIYDCLSKFMIVESEDSYYLFYMVHHIIFDAVSAGVFKHDFMTLLDGGSVDFDDGFLNSSALTHQIRKTEKFDEAKEFYHSILSDLDDIGILMEDNPSSEGYNMSTYDLGFDKGAFKSFLNNAGINENVLFTAVFSYTLSQFVNGDKAQFIMIENGRDRFSEKFIGMTANLIPVVIDCKNQSINSFIGDVADTVYGVLRYSYYPTFLLYPKYDFERDVSFQFVPNWIADEFDVLENSDDMGTEIINNVLNDFNDFVTEFFVQVYQNGNDYQLIVSHSNKYSQKMIDNFNDTYLSILSNIINEAMSSDLSSTLK